MPSIPNPTPEQQAMIEESRRVFTEAEKLPPPSKRFQAKMDDQALTNAALNRPGPARDVHREIEAMPRDEFEAEFADVLNRNAYDEDEGGRDSQIGA